MKKINVTISKGATWNPGKRIIIRTENGNMLGTVRRNLGAKIDVAYDGGGDIEISVLSPSILGEGLQRKRRTCIPDDELFAWKRELCADCIGR